MRTTGVLALLAGFLLAGFLWLRSDRQDEEGFVLTEDGWWLRSGVKGENSPEQLPVELRTRAQRGDKVVRHETWCRDLILSFANHEVFRDGRPVADGSEGAGRYCFAAAGLALGPLVLWMTVAGLLWLLPPSSSTSRPTPRRSSRADTADLPEL